MATSKKTKNNQPKEDASTAPAVNKGWQLKSAGWLVELAFRVLVGGLMVTKFDHVVALAAGFYALGTALFIVAYHVVAAHRK